MLRQKKGTSTVEFTFIILLVLAAIFLIVDLGLMLYVNLTMQHAVREGARYAITGQDNLSPAGRRAAVIQRIKNSSIGLCDRHPCTPVFYRLDSGNALIEIPFDASDPKSRDVGDPLEVIIISLDYSWPLITPMVRPFFSDGSFSFTVRSAMRNEPFPT